MADEIQTLQEKVVAFRDARNWQQFHNPKDVAISLVLEATELLEHFQWKTAGEIKDHLNTNKQEVSDELADIFYWVLLIARDFDIDLSKAVHAKLEKNELKYPVDKASGNHKKYTELS